MLGAANHGDPNTPTVRSQSVSSTELQKSNHGERQPGPCSVQ